MHRKFIVPVAERGEVRRFLQIKHAEDSRHFVEVVFVLPERFVDLLFEQQETELRGPVVPAVAVGDAGSVVLVNVICGKLVKRLGKVSDPTHIARRRPNPLKSAT